MSEKDLADILKLLIQVPGAMAVLFVVAKWVISDWFKKKSEIEKLKADLKNQEIENLKSEVLELKQSLHNYSLAMVSHGNLVESSQKQMEMVVLKVDDFSSKTSHALTEYARLTHQRLLYLEDFNKSLREKINASSIKSEKVPVGTDSVMVRTKKNE